MWCTGRRSICNSSQRVDPVGSIQLSDDFSHPNPAQWWNGNRNINVFVDNDSWILPYANQLVEKINQGGDNAALYRDYKSKPEAHIAFYLGCIKMTPNEVLSRHQRNLIPHESDLPKGRGFSPVFWQILEGEKTIPICLFEAEETPDSGLIYLKDSFKLEGHELYSEIRALQGKATLDICLRYLQLSTCPDGAPQTGEATYYKRRSKKNDELDPKKSIADQFDLLRILSENHHKSFFDFRGCRYILHIEKDNELKK
jgi:methionyl-tRNA formyltransferase